VLRDVEVELSPGRLVHVQGMNGAGKSTLLRVLAGVLPPTSGTIEGRPRRVGFAPERFPVQQPFTVSSYLHRAAEMRALSPRKATQRITDVAGLLGLEPLMGTRLPRLSKGSATKLGVAQALIAAPRLLLLDEPWSGLDSVSRANLAGELRQLVAGGTAVVYTDHSLGVTGLSPDESWSVADGTVTVTSAEVEQSRIARLIVTTDREDALALARGLVGMGRNVSLEEA
jgi:ABC-type multidrug transport system ATPase subunit